MDLMYVVSSRDAGAVLLPLLRASKRRGASWGCFFTDSGVEVLNDPQVLELMACAAQAVVCELSWERYQHGQECRVRLGSQTNHSAMMSDARHVVSL